jgi:hypothetical protein
VSVAKTILTVLTNPVGEGRDEEFNEWYDRVHVPDVLAVDGFVAVTRYRVAATQARGTPSPGYRYLAVYEIDTDDLAEALASLMRAGKSMMFTEALDLSTASAVAYDEILPRVERSSVGSGHGR